MAIQSNTFEYENIAQKRSYQLNIAEPVDNNITPVIKPYFYKRRNNNTFRSINYKMIINYICWCFVILCVVTTCGIHIYLARDNNKILKELFKQNNTHYVF